MKLPSTPTFRELAGEGELPALQATAWLNSGPLSPARLRGKVVLVQFWTYTCINWRRTLPYVRAWSDKYRAAGLVVIGVHSPEFEFEKDVERVRKAVVDADIAYPVAVDSDHSIWNAFYNQYWPALYFADGRGRIRRHQFGEGEYDSSEKAIQELLIEAGANQVPRDLVRVQPSGPELSADWSDLGSEENYFGAARTSNFAAVLAARSGSGQPSVYAQPEPLLLNHWAVVGDWSVSRGFVALNRAPGRMLYRFHARDLHLVMGPGAPRAAVRFRVRIDGQPPGAAHGSDVDEQGNGVADAPRMYQLIRQPPPIRDRDFEIEFLDSPLRAFSMTFG